MDPAQPLPADLPRTALAAALRGIDVPCVGPYVTANLIFTPGIGTELLLQQETSGLQFLAAGTGPRCTTNPAYTEPGQVTYVPPQYGQALDCIT